MTHAQEIITLDFRAFDRRSLADLVRADKALDTGSAQDLHRSARPEVQRKLVSTGTQYYEVRHQLVALTMAVR